MAPCSSSRHHSPRSTRRTSLALRTAALVALAWTAAACDEPAPVKPNPSPGVSASATAPAPPPEPFALPDPSGVELAKVGDWVDRARNKLPQCEMDKLDKWLHQAVHMPVEAKGESKKTLVEAKDITCGYETKMVCGFPGKLAKSAKFFVGSQLVCIDKGDKVVKRADWKIPPLTKRGETVDLPVDADLLRSCWEDGGVRVRMEVVGAPCPVPFPRQMRCAGEYSTCLYRCEGAESCEQTCDKNRRSCLAICKK